VLAVLLFHDDRLPGGFLGVDLFFVLSGFLITSLLVAEWDAAGRIDLRRFWIRRAKRLMPASLLMIASVALVLAVTGELARLRGQAIASLFQVANWHAILTRRDYWDLFRSPSPFEHMWSLSIEEQFYLVWPLAVWGILAAFERRAWLRVASAALLAASYWRFDVAQAWSHSRAYFGTDTRVQALLAGAIVASPSARVFGSRPLATALGAIGLLVFAASSWALHGESEVLYGGGFTAFAAVMAVLVASLASATTWPSQALSWGPLTALGRVSYGVYLWHWPVFCWLSPERMNTHYLPALTALRFACTLGIALASYRLLEQPLRTGTRPRHVRRYLVAATLALACIPSVKAFSATWRRPPPVAPLSTAAGAGDAGAPVTALRVMVLGDSTSNSLGWAIRGLREPGVTVELQGQDGCSMLSDNCGGAGWAERAKDLRPDAVLVFLGGAFLHGVTADGHWQKACHSKWDGDFETALRRRLGDLAAADGAADRRVWAVTVPYPLGPYDNATFRREVDCINAQIRAAARAVPGTRVLDLGEHLCPAAACTREVSGVPVRPDGVHFDMEGATSLSRWVLDGVAPGAAGP